MIIGGTVPPLRGGLPSSSVVSEPPEAPGPDLGVGHCPQDLLHRRQPDNEGHDEDKGGEEEGRQRQDPAPDHPRTSPAVFPSPTRAVTS